MEYVMIFLWWIAFWLLSGAAESKDERTYSLYNAMIYWLGCCSIPFCYVYAQNIWQYMLATVILTALHGGFNTVPRGTFTVFIILLGYYYKFM